MSCFSSIFSFGFLSRLLFHLSSSVISHSVCHLPLSTPPRNFRQDNPACLMIRLVPVINYEDWIFRFSVPKSVLSFLRWVCWKWFNETTVILVSPAAPFNWSASASKLIMLILTQLAFSLFSRPSPLFSLLGSIPNLFVPFTSIHPLQCPAFLFYPRTTIRSNYKDVSRFTSCTFQLDRSGVEAEDIATPSTSFPSLFSFLLPLS